MNKEEFLSKRYAIDLIIKREFPCLQAGDDSAFVHTFFWLSMYFLTISSDICPTDSTK